MRFDELLYFYAVMHKPASDSKTDRLRNNMQGFFTKLLETNCFFGASYLENEDQIQVFLGSSDKEAIAIVLRVIQEIKSNPASVKNAIQNEADKNDDSLTSYTSYIHKRFDKAYSRKISHSSKQDHITYTNLELEEIRASIRELIKVALQEKHKLNEPGMKDYYDLSFDFECKEYRLERSDSFFKVFIEKFQKVNVNTQDKDRYLALLKRESELSPPVMTSDALNSNTANLSSSSFSTLSDVFSNSLLTLFSPEKTNTTLDSDKSSSSDPTQEKEEKSCVLC